jgi:hypothetical protein
MRNYFLLIVGHIFDFYGYIFCEAAFRMASWMDRHFVYNDEKERYDGFIGLIFDKFWLLLYRVGCGFYDRAWKLCWRKIDNDLNPWKPVKDPDGKTIHVKKKGIDAIR